MRRLGAQAWLSALVLCVGCGDARGPQSVSSGDTVPAATPAGGREAAAQASPQGAEQPFARPIVVFMEASPAEIEGARGKMSDEEFQVTADDLSFYRSSAWEYLQKRGIPAVRVTGRQPLAFVVDGAARTFDFAPEPTLDLIVVFDGKRSPRAIAPVDVEAVDTLFPAAARH